MFRAGCSHATEGNMFCGPETRFYHISLVKEKKQKGKQTKYLLVKDHCRNQQPNSKYTKVKEGKQRNTLPGFGRLFCVFVVVLAKS